MPDSTMTTTLGSTPPYCFCYKPAITLHTVHHGIVYECHSTDPTLWEPQVEAPPKNLGTSSSPQTQPCSSRSVPNSPQSPVISKAHDGIQDIAASLYKMALETNTKLGTTWNSNSLEQPSAVSKTSISPQLSTRHKSSTFQSSKLVRPPSTRQKLVCGFHMHADLWELFKNLVRMLEHDRRVKKRTRRRKDCERRGQEYVRNGIWWEEMSTIKQDAVLARWHHQIVLKHPSLYSKFRAFAEKNPCKQNWQTVGRWTNWGEEVFGGKVSPLGGAPQCVCGSVMKLSWLYQGQEWSQAYFCSLRLADVKSGCSRVMNAGKWVQWQDIDPIHPLEQIEKNQVNDRFATRNTFESDKYISSDDEMSSYDNSDGDSDTTDDLTSETSDSSESEEDDEIPWDASSQPMTLKPISMPSEYEKWVIIENSKSSWLIEKDDTSYLLDEDDDLDPWGAGFVPAASSHSWTTWNTGHKSVSVPNVESEINTLKDKLDNLHNRLAPKQAVSDERMSERENILSVTQESCDRMKAYAMGLYEDGLNNPTLKCRVCKEGLLM
ncbi:hypothetical protein BGZ49_008034, partial [Haplosporangium sp. Z 27]